MLENPSQLSFSILYQDEWMVAIDKPSGIAVHRDEFTRRDEITCVQILRDQMQCALHPIHRLDGGTSGVLIFGYEREFIAALSEKFTDRSVGKTYHAITRGYVPQNVRCEQPLKKGGKFQEAATAFRCLKRIELPWPNERFAQSRYSFVEIKPETGRFHQIRRHANYLAYPLVGDTAHGDNIHNDHWRSQRNCHRLLLHAGGVQFIHPMTSVLTKISSPLPGDFQRHLDELCWVDLDPASSSTIEVKL